MVCDLLKIVMGGYANVYGGDFKVHASENRVVNELKKVLQKWDRNSPDCEFKVYFYNNVGPDNASRHVKPLNEDEKAYDKAWTERPNSGYVFVSKTYRGIVKTDLL